MAVRRGRLEVTRERFEVLAEEAFAELPEVFGERLENVHVVIDDLPSEDICRQMRVSKRGLLGLYQGIPLTHRGTWYGTSPTMPDRIWLFQRNIEAECDSEEDLSLRIQEVLFHEIGHYFGMTEAQIRKAMKRFFE